MRLNKLRGKVGSGQMGSGQVWIDGIYNLGASVPASGIWCTSRRDEYNDINLKSGVFQSLENKIVIQKCHCYDYDAGAKLQR